MQTLHNEKISYDSHSGDASNNASLCSEHSLLLQKYPTEAKIYNQLYKSQNNTDNSILPDRNYIFKTRDSIHDHGSSKFINNIRNFHNKCRFSQIHDAVETKKDPCRFLPERDDIGKHSLINEKLGDLTVLADTISTSDPPQESPLSDKDLEDATSVFGPVKSPLLLDEDELYTTIKKLNVDSSTGVSSDSFSMWKRMFYGKQNDVRNYLLPMVNNILIGNISAAVMEILNLSRVIPIPKNNADNATDFRPLGIGASLYRIINKSLVMKLNNKVCFSLLSKNNKNNVGFQTCVGISDACPTIGAILQGYVNHLSESSDGSIDKNNNHEFKIISLDASNAFNSISLTSIYHGLQEYCPELIPWFLLTYGKSTKLIMSNGSILGHQQTGVKQGDPLAMMLFAIGLQSSLNKISDLIHQNSLNMYKTVKNGISNPQLMIPPLTISYADDISIAAPMNNWNEISIEISNILKNNCGLILNLQKTQILNVSALRDTPHDPNLGIKIVGIPIGSQGYISQFARTTLSSIRADLDLIKDYATELPKQYLFSLLKFCITSRAVYLMRTIDPLEKRDKDTGDIMENTFKCPINRDYEDFDAHVVDAIFNIIGNEGLSNLMLSAGSVDNGDLQPLFARDILNLIKDIPVRNGGLGIYDCHGTRRQLAILSKRDSVFRFVAKYIPELQAINIFENIWNSYPIPIISPRLPANMVDSTNLPNGNWYTLKFDGGSRGNSSGAAGAGWAIFDSNETVISEGCQYLGSRGVTNNEAEYTAFIMGLELALEKKITHLHIYGDSELIVKQINKVNEVTTQLGAYNFKVKQLLAKFTCFTIKHVGRDSNQLADSLANKAMDKQVNAMNIPPKPVIDDIDYCSLVLDEQGFTTSTKVMSPIPILLENGKYNRTAKQCKDSIKQSLEDSIRIKQTHLIKIFMKYGLHQLATQFTSQACREAGVWLNWMGNTFCRFGYENQNLNNFGELLRVRCCLPNATYYSLASNGTFRRTCSCFNHNPASYSEDIYHILGCPINSITRTKRHDQVTALLVSLMRKQARLGDADGNDRNLRIDPRSITTEEPYGKENDNGYRNKSDICLTVFNKRTNTSERLILDIMITNPTSKKYMRHQPSPPTQNFASEMGRRYKLEKYAAADNVTTSELSKNVIPLLFETTGRVHPKTKSFLDDLFQDTRTNSTLRQRLYTSLSFIIQRHNGNLLRRESATDSTFISYI